MSEKKPDLESRVLGRPLFVVVMTVLLGIGAVGAIAGGIILGPLGPRPEEGGVNTLQTLLAAVILAALSLLVGWGLWNMKNWARTAVILVVVVGLIFFLVSILFEVSSQIFAGEKVMPIIGPMGGFVNQLVLAIRAPEEAMAPRSILEALLRGGLKTVIVGLIPGLIIYGMMKVGAYFEETPGERNFIDRGIRYLLVATALSAIFIVFLIILFTMIEAWESIEKVGLDTMLLGTVWRPGSIIGTEDAQFGLVPMIVGAILSTFGAVILGVPLSIGTAIVLAEIAPPLVREILRPLVELLAGIPSVVYGLFGMVVLAPLIRHIEVPGNTGFGLLNASIILAVMILPTVTNITEDAIRAVPRHYKEGSLALGSTHWQTIWSVMLPAARSGIVAAIILGIGRALGETMALIMVIGNSIAMPKPVVSGNPLTLFLSTARTLTGNIAVEINYAAGAHRSALFFTGVLLFLMILIVNSAARFLMRERLSS